jgi:hypothetical protein
MSQSESPVFATLEAYLSTLDHAPLSAYTILESEDDKERYETFLMYSFRKYQAAQYHYTNIRRCLEKDDVDHEEEFKTFTEKVDDKDEKLDRLYQHTAVMKTSRSADHYVYELAAFLEALKSAVDFLARVCAFHLSGISLDSITTLMKLVKKGRSNSILAAVKNNIEWLEKLRDYRHHVVHRRIFSTSAGGEAHIVSGVARSVVYPVVIPESPPAYLPDTRASRLHGDEILMNSEKSESWIMAEDGRKKILDLSIKYTPASGYISLEEFARHHIGSFEKFFTEILKALMALQFQDLVS